MSDETASNPPSEKIADPFEVAKVLTDPTDPPLAAPSEPVLHSEKCRKLKQVLTSLVEALDKSDGDKGCVNVCKAGDEIRACLGGNDNDTVCASLEHCGEIPLRVKALVSSILHELPRQWHDPSIARKMEIITDATLAIELLK